MDGSRFDSLARTLGTAGSRRRALGGVLAGAFGILGSRAEEAAAKKKCPPCKKRKQGKCKKTLPDGTACENGGKCQGGRCAAAVSPPCLARCGTNTCGPDGCGGSCGACSGGTCLAGTCDCPVGQELCRGACVTVCASGEVRNPIGCGCCQTTNQLCGAARDFPAPDNNCCSGFCKAGPGAGFCEGRTTNATCEFGAQCQTGLRCIAGKCCVECEGVCVADDCAGRCGTQCFNLGEACCGGGALTCQVLGLGDFQCFPPPR